MSKRNNSNSLIAHVKIEHVIGGICGGVTSTFVLHPLDLLRVRFAVNDGQLLTRPNYQGLSNAFTTIVQKEGVRGLFRGVTPNCFGSGAAWGIYFLFYNAIKGFMLDDGKKKTLSAGNHMLAAAEAGLVTLMLTNPIWVVKTRMCLEYSTASGLSTSSYSGILDGLVKIYKHEGIPGMYKGLVPSMFGISQCALQFMAYEEMKKYYINHYKKLPAEDNTQLGTTQYLLFAAMSKMFAASLTYPYQVIRERLQDRHSNYSGVFQVIKQAFRHEGMRGFYKGLPAYLLHITPNVCIVFLIYENLTRVLESKRIFSKDDSL